MPKNRPVRKVKVGDLVRAPDGFEGEVTKITEKLGQPEATVSSSWGVKFCHPKVLTILPRSDLEGLERRESL
jgi:hypothetical protein